MTYNKDPLADPQIRSIYQTLNFLKNNPNEAEDGITFKLTEDVHLRMISVEYTGPTEVMLELILRKSEETKEKIITANELRGRSLDTSDEAQQAFSDNLVTASEVDQTAPFACFLRGMLVGEYGNEKISETPDGSTHPVNFVCLTEITADGHFTQSGDVFRSGPPPFDDPAHIFVAAIQPTE